MKYNKHFRPSLHTTGLDKVRRLKPGPDFVLRTATKIGVSDIYEGC
jgi:beta-phosphoglucomutase-like phosphatase (HAD superfamily)